MLTKPEGEALAALVAFSRQPRWRDFSRMIDNEIAAATEYLLKAADIRSIGEFQGRIKALKELQAKVHEAPELMEKMGFRALL